MSDTHIELRAGDLTAVVGDNSACGDHRAGYNGLWSLKSAHQPANLFVPSYAGLNLEHVMDGRDLTAEDRVFEPRRAPMALRPKSGVEVELYQPPTPITKSAGITRCVFGWCTSRSRAETTASRSSTRGRVAETLPEGEDACG